MKDKKFQIFVSSTYTDLKEERQAAVEAILSSGHIPAGMELFSAGDESQMSVIKRWIDESDIYLLIFGGRYGSVDLITGKSYTHLEYEYALEKNKPIFAVVIEENALEEKVKTLGTIAMEKENPKLLAEFKIIVLKNLVKFWEDKKDIKLAIHETISDFTYNKELIGWIRGDNAVNTGALAEEIGRLTKENFDLRTKISTLDFKNTPLYSNLTFEELSALLKAEKIEIEDTEYNMLDFLLLIADQIQQGKMFHIDYRFQKLIQFRIIERVDDGLMRNTLTFTDSGHNFYMKLLIQSAKNV